MHTAIKLWGLECDTTFQKNGFADSSSFLKNEGITAHVFRDATAKGVYVGASIDGERAGRQDYEAMQ